MLVLSRKRDEVIHIGPDISVRVIRIGPNAVRLGIEAPEHIPIHRDEVRAAMEQAERPASQLRNAQP